MSASKTGQASAGVGYNYGGHENVSPLLKGTGGSITFSNDGSVGVSGQIIGATIGSIAYNTETRQWGKLALNENFQYEFNQGWAADNAANNEMESSRRIADVEGETLVREGKLSREQYDDLLAKDPGALREKFAEYSHTVAKDDLAKLISTMEGVVVDKGMKLDLRNDSPEGVSGFFKKLSGSIKQSFGITDDGIAAIDKDGNFKYSVCFTAGTLVATKEGFKHIEEIKVGDEILSWNEITGKTEYRKVLQLFQRQVDGIYKVQYENGNVVEVTSEHPFYIQGKGWVLAKDLKVGDISKTSNSNGLSIASVEFDQKEETVYNFEVEENHTYFVSKDGVLVHNECFNVNSKEAEFLRNGGVLFGEPNKIAVPCQMECTTKQTSCGILIPVIKVD